MDQFIPTDDAAPQVVLLTDGMEWIRNHVGPQMPAGTVLILDFYHALEHLAECASTRFGAGTKLAKSWDEQVRTQLFGKRGYRKKRQEKRRGHKKTKTTSQHPFRTVHTSEHPHGAGDALVWELIEDNVDDKLTPFSADPQECPI
jgi:hypothetical protein